MKNLVSVPPSNFWVNVRKDLVEWGTHYVDVVFIFLIWLIWKRVIETRLSEISIYRYNSKDEVSIQNLISECRAYSNADRVCIYQFHNGDYYFSGKSISKMTLTHEVDASGVMSISNTRRDIICSLYTTYLAKLEIDKEIRVHTKDLGDGDPLRRLAIQAGTHHYMSRMLFGQYGPIGIVSIQYTRALDTQYIDNFTFSSEPYNSIIVRLECLLSEEKVNIVSLIKDFLLFKK